MARNASGTYSRVVDPYVNGAVIDAEDHNDEHDDFGAELTDSLNRSGKGGMLAALKLANGTLASPGAHFTGQTNTGFYLNAAGDLRCAVAAADLQRWTAALVRIETTLLVNGNVECNAMDASGSATVGGTLAVTGASTLTGNTTVGGTLGVTGNTTLGGSVAAWVASTAYTIGNQVIANGNIYVCDTNGTSASSGTGPSGTGTNIADGTTQWDYVSTAATLAVAGIATFKSQAVVAAPTSNSHAATKGYADAAFGAALIAFGAGDLTNATDEYLYPWYESGNASATNVYRVPVPFAGRVSRLYVRLNTATNGDSVVYTVQKNGVDTALTTTLASGATSGSDTTHEFTVAAGDYLTLHVSTGASALTAANVVIVTMALTLA